MDRVPLYITAGGKSSRFGRDKARALLAGRPLLLHLARQLAEHVSSTVVIADQAGKYEDLGLTTLADLSPGRGPLAGLQAALHHAGEGWLLLTSCDLPDPRPEWLQLLLQARRPGASAVAFRHRFWEPLFALYHASLGPAVDARLAAGELAMQALLDGVGACAVPMPEGYAALPQVNTPQDLERLRPEETP